MREVNAAGTVHGVFNKVEAVFSTERLIQPKPKKSTAKKKAK